MSPNTTPIDPIVRTQKGSLCAGNAWGASISAADMGTGSAISGPASPPERHKNPMWLSTPQGLRPCAGASERLPLPDVAAAEDRAMNLSEVITVAEPDRRPLRWPSYALSLAFVALATLAAVVV